MFGGRRWCVLAEGGVVPGDIEATAWQRVGNLPELSAPAMLYRCNLTRYAKVDCRATVTFTSDPNSPNGVCTNHERRNATQYNPLPPSSIGASASQLTRQLIVSTHAASSSHHEDNAQLSSMYGAGCPSNHGLIARLVPHRKMALPVQPGLEIADGCDVWIRDSGGLLQNAHDS